jgi:hypothetical protein
MRVILNLENIGLVRHAASAAQAFFDHYPGLKDMAMTHLDGSSSWLERRPTGTIVVTTKEAKKELV